MQEPKAALQRGVSDDRFLHRNRLKEGKFQALRQQLATFNRPVAWAGHQQRGLAATERLGSRELCTHSHCFSQSLDPVCSEGAASGPWEAVPRSGSWKLCPCCRHLPPPHPPPHCQLQHSSPPARSHAHLAVREQGLRRGSSTSSGAGTAPSCPP